MNVGIRCPSCSAGLKVRESRLGTLVRCPSCDEKFICTPPDDADGGTLASIDSPTALTTREVAPGLSRSDAAPAATSAGVSELITGGLAVLVTAAVHYGAILPFRHTKIGAMLAGGWVPTATLFLAIWAAMILLFKLAKTRRQRASLLYDVLPNEISSEIRPDNVEEFRRHILGLPVKAGSSFLLNRVLRGLDHFRIRRDPQIVSSQLASQAEIDAVNVESSYSMVKVFIWAVPILGFIGTVLGIGDAVGTFSASVNSAQDIESVKTSLAGVTKGLGFAFDTTLIALVISVFLMLPMQWLQKAEEGVLAAVADYCNEELLIRLHAEEADKPDPTAGLRSVVDTLAASQREAMQAWKAELASIGTQLADDVAGGWRKAGSEMEQAFQKQMSAVQATVANSLEQQYGQVGTWLGKLEEIGTRLDEQAATRWQAIQTATNEAAQRSAQAASNVVTEIRTTGTELLKQQQAQHEHAETRAAELLAGVKTVAEGQAAAVAGVCATLEKNLLALQTSAATADRARTEGLVREAQEHRTVLDVLRNEAGGIGKAFGEIRLALHTDLQQVTKTLTDAAASNATGLRTVTESLERTVRDFTASLDRIGTAQAQRLDATVEMLRELHTGIHEDVPATLQAQANALKVCARESHELAKVQRALADQVAKITANQTLATTLVELQRTIARLDQRLEAKAGVLSRFFNRNGTKL